MNACELNDAINSFRANYSGRLWFAAHDICTGRFENVLTDLRRNRYPAAHALDLIDTAEERGILAGITARVYRERVRRLEVPL